MNTKVGFIGIGNMGYGMVKNLLAHDFTVLAFDIDQEKLKSVIQLGAKKSASVKNIADIAETVILALPHPDISNDVLSVLSQGKVKAIIETSTLTPEDSSKFRTELTKKNIQYLCAPMLAGKQMALEGKIHFVVEGEKDVYKKYEELFNIMGNATYMGDVPNATLAKLAYNICRYSNVSTALTVIQFLKKYSNNLSPIYDVLADGSLDNFGQVWKQEMGEVAIDDKPYKFAGNKIPLKDLSLVIKMATEKDLPEGLFREIKNVYEEIDKGSKPHSKT